MPWNQTTFTDRLAAAFPGMVANTRPSDIVSKLCADAGGFTFGLPVFQGAAANQVTATFTLNKFLGVVLKDITKVRGAADAAFVDKIKQYGSCAVVREGVVWVTTALAVAVDDPAYITPAGGYTNVSNGGANEGPIGRWDSATSGAALARLELLKRAS
jgi:hypothetical protein